MIYPSIKFFFAAFNFKNACQRFILFSVLFYSFLSSRDLIAQDIFSTPGTYTWTVPACVTQITVRAWGGGGGGGSIWVRFDPTSNSPTTNEACVAAGGGGGGGYVSRTYNVIPGQVYTIVVGDGGNGGPINASGNNRANNGLPGENSTFSGPATAGPGTLSAFGGNGGSAANFLRSCLGGCSGANHQGVNGTGGSGSGGANGTTTFNGGNGSAGVHAGNTQDRSGAGGGGAGSTGNGGNASSTNGGAGGSGGGGNGGNGIVQPFGNGFLGTAGNNGSSIGGGGGGAAGHNRSSNSNTHFSRVGGKGGIGEVRIEYNSSALPEPTFSAVNAICQGDPLNPLPTTSINGINGTWSPALNNISTTTYTFTPDPLGPCADSTTLTITVNTSTTPSFNAVAPICSGEPLSALPTTSNEGIVGIWSPSVNNTATTTYTFTPNAGQCAIPANLTVTVNPSTKPTFANVAAICSGENLNQLPSNSINGINGSWSPILNNTATTTYVFTPNNGQCADTTSLTIVVNPANIPTFNLVSSICEGQTLSPFPSTSNEGINGTWSPVINDTVTTTYTFTPAAGQCASNVNQTITINPLPVTNWTPPLPICEGSGLSVILNTLLSPNASSGGIFSGTGVSSNIFNSNGLTAGTYPVKYLVSNAQGCADSTTENITIIPSLAVNAISSGGLNVCPGATDTLFASGNASTYSWLINGVFTSTANPFIITAIPNNNLNVSLIGSANNACSDTLELVYVLLPKTNLTLNVDTNQAVCEGSITNFIASGANTYTWYSSGLLLDSDSLFSVIHNSNGSFNYQLIGNAINSCPDSLNISILVNPKPVVNAGNTINSTCGQSNGSVLGITGGASYNYTWNNAGGQVVGDSSSIVNITSGVYQLNVVDTITGCSNTYTYTINDTSNIKANFSANDTVFTLGDSPVVVNFTNNSVNAITYNWDFGNGTGSVLQTPSTQYSSAGLYQVVLEVKGNGNCIDYDTLYIRIIDSAYTWFPNIFTPNSDNENDLFFIRSTEIKDLEVKIFNRWGLSIYEYKGIGGTWDGRTQAGDEVPDGVYYYILNGTYKNGQPIEDENRAGFIRLIRNKN